MYLWMWIEKDFGGVVTVRRDCWVEGVGGHWFKNVYPEREFQKSLPCAAMLSYAKLFVCCSESSFDLELHGN